MRLLHLHLPKPISYSHSLHLQEAVLERQFSYNSSRLQSRSPSSSSAPPPLPTLLTFQTTPTYTVGRRHLKSNPLSDSQIQFLVSDNLATFHASPRGGLLTYHAPGQLTAYLIYNLRYHNITPRCHVRLLEESVIRTASSNNVETTTSSDPGVWIQNSDGSPSDRKLCAIGVHVVRGITSHGIGLNIFDQKIESLKNKMYTLPQTLSGSLGLIESSTPAPGYLSWGFSRITACGLEGKSVTWLTREGADTNTNLAGTADVLAQEVCRGLSEKGKVEVEGVDKIQEEDILDQSGTVDNLKGQKVENMKGGLDDWVDVLKGGKM